MEKVLEESKGGLYDVYYTSEDTRLIVLSGLNVENQYEAPPLQQYIHEHYGLISLFYWVIFTISLIYMTGIHIIIPLLRRYDLY